MANPTSGFQLSKLPEPLSIPTNIGVVDVGQMQKAYSNAMQNVQDTALFGQRVAQQKAMLDLQEQAARSQQRLLPTQETATKRQLEYNAAKAFRDAGLLNPEGEKILRELELGTLQATEGIESARGRLPYARPAADIAGRTNVITGLGGLRAATIGTEALGETIPPELFNVPPVTLQRQTPLGSFGAAPTAPAPAPAPAPVVGQPSGRFPAPAATTPPLANVVPQPEAQPAPATPLAQVAPQLPSGAERTQSGDYMYGGVTIPQKTFEAPAIQNLIRQGFMPQGNATAWLKIDRDNLTQQEVKVTPQGIAIGQVTSLPAGRIQQVANARQAEALAKEFDPNFTIDPKAPDQQVIRDAARIYTQREVKNPDHLFPAINPGAGIADPNKNAEAQKRKRDMALVEINQDRNLRTDIENVRANLQEFKTLNDRLPTGPITANVVGKYLSFGGNIGDFLDKLTDEKEKSFFQDNADTLNRMRILHSESIPGLLRGVNGKIAATNATGGAAGIGRIMFNEVPWFASGSPAIDNSQRVNTSLINSNLAKTDKLLDLMSYRDAFFNSFGYLDGSTSNFNRYEANNPYFKADGAINNDRASWTEGLMSPQWREQNGDQPRRVYENVFHEGSFVKPAKPTGVDINAMPSGLTSKEELSKALRDKGFIIVP